MTDITKKIEKLVDLKLRMVNTVALGILTDVNLTKLRCNVLLKHKIQGKTIELYDVPIALQKYHDSVIVVTPKVGDVVLVIFSKHELEEQLKDKKPAPANEKFLFSLNNAIVVAGIYTATDKLPELKEDSILIKHTKDNQMLITEDEILIKHAENSLVSITEDEIKILHKSGAYLHFKSDGSLEIKAKRVDFVKL